MTPPTWLYWPAAGGGGGTPWAPTDLADLVAWFKADAISGLSDNNPVSTWEDSHGSYDVSAPSTERPIYKTGIQNSLPVVRFDGSNDRLKRSGSPITGTVARTFGIVAKADVADAGGIVGIGQEGATLSSGKAFDITPEVAVRVVGSKTFTTGLGTTDFRVLIVSCPASCTVTDVNAWVDGSALTQNTTSGTSINTRSASEEFVIGERAQNANPSNFDGDIGEIVVCDAELAQADREKLEGYLAWKWGLEANLPNGHPYENAAP